MESIGIDKARADLGGIADRVHHKDDAALITRAGKPWTVMVSYDTALAVLGIAASTVGGGEYARLRRGLREAARDSAPDSPDAPQVTDREESPALCLVNRISVHFTWK